MSEELAKLVDPARTMIVLFHGEKEVGRIPATSPSAIAYIETLTSYYGPLNTKFEYDEFASLLTYLLT